MHNLILWVFIVFLISGICTHSILAQLISSSMINIRDISVCLKFSNCNPLLAGIVDYGMFSPDEREQDRRPDITGLAHPDAERPDAVTDTYSHLSKKPLVMTSLLTEWTRQGSGGAFSADSPSKLRRLFRAMICLVCTAAVHQFTTHVLLLLLDWFVVPVVLKIQDLVSIEEQLLRKYILRKTEAFGLMITSAYTCLIQVLDWQ